MGVLVDKFNREHNYLRISVTDRCNLRCLYCMPPEGVRLKKHDEILTFEEIYRLAKIFVSLGVKKIRITGGEPLVRKNLVNLIDKLASISGLEHLAMTTNGVLLAEYAEELKRAGLNSLNISIDSLRRDRFREITLRDDLSKVLSSIEKAYALNFQPLKLNVVVIKNKNSDEVIDFVHFVKNKNMNVRFIEYMPFKDNSWNEDEVLVTAEIKKIIENEFKLIEQKSSFSNVAKDYLLQGYRGSISFISSMSDSFCSTCNRLRLTADGSIKSCLFYEPEINLREYLRQSLCDEDLAAMIISALQMKPEAHPPMNELALMSNRAMVEIGG